MEQKQKSEKSDVGMVKPDIQRDAGSEHSGKLQGSVNTEPVFSPTPAPVPPTEKPKTIMTNQEFVESKLNNCQTFVQKIECLKGTTLLAQFMEFKVKDILEYMIWMMNTKRTIETGLAELFVYHKLNINDLKKEEYERLRQYFLCFQSIVQQNSQ